MPFEKGNQLAKNNPNVGRKSIREERAKVSAIKKAWDKVEQELDSKPVEKIAFPIAIRDMTEKTDITSKGEKIEGINYIKPDGNNRPTTDTKTTPSV